MKLQKLPTELLALIKSYVDNSTLAQFNASCPEIANAYMSLNEKSARKCGYHGKAVKEVFDAKSFTCGHVECFRYLQQQVSEEYFLKYIRASDNSILRWAVANKHIEVVKLLLTTGLTANDVRSFSNGAIISACFYGDLEMVKLLLTTGLTANDIRTKNNDPLYLASMRGCTEIVRIFINIGLTADDILSRSDALAFSAQNGHFEVVQLLISTVMASRGQQSVLEMIRDKENYALQSASLFGHLEVVKLLMSTGLTVEDVRERGNYPCGAFRRAAEGGHVLVRGSNGFGAFHLAAEGGRHELVRFLLTTGLTLDDVRDMNNYALRKATEKGYLEVVNVINQFIEEHS